MDADLILLDARIHTLDPTCSKAEAIAIRGERILATGSNATVEALAGPATQLRRLGGATVIPGLVDSHAHLDREGLKARLPSLAGCTSIKDLIARLAELCADRPAGEWLVTMPLGDPPFYLWTPESYAEGRLPTRHDLDCASTSHPILIRPPWGYWPAKGPTPCIANSLALARAGIGRHTVSPSPKLEIERDSQGDPTGVFLEHERMPLSEFTLFSLAPAFGAADRYAALLDSMQAYNRFGTTSVIEGHGVAPATLRAWQSARDADRLSVRAHLMLSPAWGRASADDVRALINSWAGWLRGRGLGDDWLAMSGLYTEIDESNERLIRAAAAPQTGWAGFCYDASIPRSAVVALLAECARNGIRVSAIYPEFIDLFAEANRVASIAEQRWVLCHQSMLNAGQIAQLRDLGVGLSLHPNAHIWKRGSELVRAAGDRLPDLVPVRNLLDAGVRTAIGTDNVPISMFGPMGYLVGRTDRAGKPVNPSQAITAEEALRCATIEGAWLSFDESRKGRLTPGMLADMVVLDQDPLSLSAPDISSLEARLTLCGGRVVYERASSVS